jgi:hypothetical protein
MRRHRINRSLWGANGRGVCSSALFGVSLCLLVSSCVVDSFTIRSWNVGPMARGAPPFNPVRLLDTKLSQVLSKQQDGAVLSLTPVEVELIGLGLMNAEGMFESKYPKSILMGIDLAPGDTTFTEWRGVLVSGAVKDNFYAVHAGALWNVMLKQDEAMRGYFKYLGTRCNTVSKQDFVATRDYFLQSHVRHLLKGPSRDGLYLEEARIGVGMEEEGRGVSLPITIPRCNEIQFVDDPATCLADPGSRPFVLYHAFETTSDELIDCLYKDNYDNVYAIKSTAESSGHPANPDKMVALQETLRDYKNITLCFMVPSEIFSDFVTDPPNPTADPRVTLNIFHAALQRPSK